MASHLKFIRANSYRITADDPYFIRARMQWAAGLQDMLAALPEPPDTYDKPRDSSSWWMVFELGA